jgi:uncharacterized protein (DUF1778 family)
MALTEAKSERIDIRTTLGAKDTLQRAALAAHKNVSEFLLDAGMAAASEALADRHAFQLDDAQWQDFQEALDRPIKHKSCLEKLLSEPSILD